MERRDPNIGFVWGVGGPGGGVWADNFLVRWTAEVTVPAAGNYRFVYGGDDGVRISVKKAGPTSPVVQVLDAWGVGAHSVGIYAGAVSAAQGETLTLGVDYMEATGDAYADVWLEGPTGAGGALKLAPLDPSWLGADTPPLPVGWTLSPGLGYASARVVDDHIVLTDASGASHVYAGRAGGHVPPPEEDGILALDATGGLTLHDDDGTTYAFDAGNGHVVIGGRCDAPALVGPVARPLSPRTARSSPRSPAMGTAAARNARHGATTTRSS